jgi:hypothetical protein
VIIDQYNDNLYSMLLVNIGNIIIHLQDIVIYIYILSIIIVCHPSVPQVRQDRVARAGDACGADFRREVR